MRGLREDYGNLGPIRGSRISGTVDEGLGANAVIGSSSRSRLTMELVSCFTEGCRAGVRRR